MIGQYSIPAQETPANLVTIADSEGLKSGQNLHREKGYIVPTNNCHASTGGLHDKCQTGTKLSKISNRFNSI
jgi:hypothetical protein